jgi:hypothetical protein
VGAPRMAAARLLARHRHELLGEFACISLGLETRLLVRRRHLWLRPSATGRTPAAAAASDSALKASSRDSKAAFMAVDLILRGEFWTQSLCADSSRPRLYPCRVGSSCPCKDFGAVTPPHQKGRLGWRAATTRLGAAATGDAWRTGYRRARRLGAAAAMARRPGSSLRYICMFKFRNIWFCEELLLAKLRKNIVSSIQGLFPVKGDVGGMVW